MTALLLSTLNYQLSTVRYRMTALLLSTLNSQLSTVHLTSQHVGSKQPLTQIRLLQQRLNQCIRNIVPFRIHPILPERILDLPDHRSAHVAQPAFVRLLLFGAFFFKVMKDGSWSL